MNNPKLILHIAISADGRIHGFEPDMAQFYGVAGIWDEDCTLSTSVTIAAADSDTADTAEIREWKPDSDDKKAILAIVDHRGTVDSWHSLRTSGYWRDAVALVSESTPAEYLTYLSDRNVSYIIAGADHVDMKHALSELAAKYNVQTVRADCGGTMNGILLRDGLVDEVSIVIHPALAGGDPAPTIFEDSVKKVGGAPIELELISVKELEKGLVWLRYTIKYTRTQ